MKLRCSIQLTPHRDTPTNRQYGRKFDEMLATIFWPNRSIWE